MIVDQSLIDSVRDRARKYPNNEWAQQIVAVCDFASDALGEEPDTTCLYHRQRFAQKHGCPECER